MAEKIDEREAAIQARMTDARGALNYEQAALAVDLQIENDAANKEAAPKSKKKADTAE